MQARTVRRIALELPDAEERETWETATFRVRNKIFVMFAERERELWIKSTHDEQKALTAMDPGTFFVPRTWVRAAGSEFGSAPSIPTSSASW